jgi:hypothetical protein
MALIATLLFSQEAALATVAPTVTPSTGTYSTAQPTATITVEPGATAYYTLNGSTPSSGSTPYTTPIPLGDTTVIRTISYLSGVPSTVTDAFIDNDPNSLPVPRTGLQLWLKGSFGPVLNSGKVSQWTDLSGVTPPNNATQGTSGNQPTVLADAINGEDVVAFNGSSSYMTLTTGLNNLSTGMSLFAVIRPETASGAETLITSGNAGVTDMVSLQTTGTVATANFNNGATTSSVATPSSSLTTNKFQIISVVHNGAASAAIEVNAVPKQSGTVQNLATSARIVNRVGVNSALTASSFWQGRVAELLLYSRGLTSGEQAAVNAYLTNRYQIVTATATAAPIISVPTSTLAEPSQVAIYAPAEATIYMATDGSTPVAGSSPVYSAPFRVIYTQTIKAIAVTPGGGNSSVATSTLTLNAAKFPAPDPTDLRPLHINLQLPTTAIPE